MTLRSTPTSSDTPPARKSAAVWNPETGTLDYPPTRAQLRFLRDLALKTRARYTDPTTKAEAAREIERLLRVRRARKRRSR